MLAKTTFEKGMEKGREVGELIGQIRLCQELLHQEPTPRAELNQQSIEYLTALLAQLRQRLSSNGH